MSIQDPMGDRWAGPAPAAEDLAYRTQSLRFTGVEVALDESISFRALFRLWLYAAVAGGLVNFVFFLIYVLKEIGGDGSSSGSPQLVGTGIVLSFLVFWVVLFLLRVPEPVAEWKTLIEGKAAAADSSYAAIYQSLARRRIPVAVAARRIRSDLVAESVNNRLIITERSYTAYVSVFAFGTSLYVGWTMWRDRRGHSLLAQFVKDLAGSVLGRTGIINQMLRTERVRAMREAVHSAVREGVDAAIEDIEVPIVATFGYDIPIETVSSTSTEQAVPPGGVPAQRTV